MKSKLFILGFVLALSALVMSGCGPATAEPAPAPTNGPRPVTHSAELREGETYTIALETDPSSGHEWEVKFSEAFLELVERTPDDAAGEEVFTFRALSLGTTEVYFSYSRPHEVIYNFTIGADPALAEAMSEAEAREIAASSECGEAGALLENAFYNDWTATWWIDLDAQKEGCAPACVVNVKTRQAEINWRCTGALPPAGTAEPAPTAEPPTETPPTEAPTPTAGQPVVAWGGFVHSLPADAEFDDFVALQPEGAGAFGLTSEDNTVEAQIQMLRDSDTYAHFWGTLVCPANDYDGCQLVITRLREDRPGPFFDPDPVDGWEGTVVGTPEGAQFDDKFILAGHFPVGYGIGSADPELATQLESLRDTGTTVRVWGKVEAGVIDTFGSHIEVTRLEVVGAGAPATGYDDTGWKTYANETFGYRLKYPGDATLLEASQGTGIQISGPLVDNERWPMLEVSHYDSDFYHPPAGTDVFSWVTDAGMPYDELDAEAEIAGLPAVHLVTQATNQSYAYDEYYVIKGGQLFRILILHDGGREDWGLYNQFLRSFSFD